MSGKHRLKAVGKLIAERIANIASVVYNATYDRGRILYDNTTQQLYYGNNQTASFRTVFDIPIGTIVLFEADTARLGYSLLTTLNDYIVYATRGSVAGGEAGASDKSGGTWSQSSHQHSMNSHTHNVSHYHSANHYHTVSSSHSHRWLYYNAGNTYSWDSGGNLIAYNGIIVGGGTGLVIYKTGNGHLDNVLGDFYTDSSTPGISTTSFNTSTDAPISSVPNTANTDSSAPANSWRPVGLNFTRQQRV
jgi:hypothetical protein